MTDSESDTSNNVFTFQSVNTTVSARGPNTNISNLSFRNPMTSTMYMPRNFERRRYAESVCDQGSMYYRRETSPMSIRSACDARPRNFQPYYPRSSQRSVYNGRSGSPMSMRSMDSTASVSAADIAFAFQNVNFNKTELNLIKHAYNKLMKHKVRKRIEKRRNLRLLLKGNRRQSGYDSGEQGSNSSISSDDCRSVKTCYNEMSSVRSTRIDVPVFRNSMKDNNMLKDCSDNVKQNTFRNMFSVGYGNLNTPRFNNLPNSKQGVPKPTQRERFQNSLLLPSQRFNKAVASSTILENSEKQRKNIGFVKNPQNRSPINNTKTSGSEEEIFSKTIRENSTYNVESKGKRSLDSDDDLSLPDKKKSKLSSPIKKAPKNIILPVSKTVNVANNNKENSNYFEFAKPSLPLRKSKCKMQEKVIEKTSLPNTDILVREPLKINEKEDLVEPLVTQEMSNMNEVLVEQSETSENNDVSMRPSFIKRKLFTQKLDVVEKANISCDNNSPQSSVYTLQKEKNKARKLVTNQLCLNREVQDESNLLELIHKIVPPDRMNVTNQSSVNQTRTDIKINRNGPSETNDIDKFDVTTVMSNENKVSDSFSDDKIFEADNNKDSNKVKQNNCKTNSKTPNKQDQRQPFKQCTVMVEKLQSNSNYKKQINNSTIPQICNIDSQNVPKNFAKTSGKSFWDTDCESDVDYQNTATRNHIIETLNRVNAKPMENNKPGTESTKPLSYANSQFTKKSLNIPETSKLINSSLNTTIMSNAKFNTSTLSVRSHRNPIKKKCCHELCIKENKPDKQVVNSIIINGESNKKLENTIIDEPKAQTKSTNKILKTKTPNGKAQRNVPEKKKNNNEKVSKACKKSPKSKNMAEVTAKKKEDSKSKVQNKCIKDISNPKHNTSENPKNSKVRHKSTNKNSSKITDQNSTKKYVPPLNKQNDTLQVNTTRSERPIRSCRNSSQNRSGLISGNSNTSISLSSSIDVNRTLRSRVINLSSSIENITIEMKPRNKPVKKINKPLNTRISDISFTLRSMKQTPTPKKKISRSKADYFKGKR